MDSFSSKPEPKLKSDIFKGISSNPPNSKQNQSSTGMSLNKPISPSGYDPFSSTGASKGLPKPNKVDLGKPGDIFSDMDPFNSNNQNTTNQSSFTSTKPAAKLSDPFNNFASSFSASKPSQDSISFKTQTINMTSGFKSMSDGSDPFAEILGEEKKEEPKINTFASFGSGFDSNKEFLNFNQAKKTPPPTNAPYPKQTSVGGSSSDPFGSFLNSTQKQSKPSGGSMSLGGSSGIGGKSAFSLDPQPPAKTPSFPSDSFSTGAPRTGSFKSTTGNKSYFKQYRSRNDFSKSTNYSHSTSSWICLSRQHRYERSNGSKYNEYDAWNDEYFLSTVQ